MIDFRTYEEQLEILERRGMIISDRNAAKQFLERNNYYNVINAYKDIFIDKKYSQEKYKKEVSFNDFVALWLFDKDLRQDFSNVATIIERTLKSKIAYVVSKRYGVMDINYLDIDNFKQNGKYLFESNKLIKRLLDLKNTKIEKRDVMICHCVNNYNCVPMWIFVNIMSFGDTMKFYECINESTQIEIAQDLSSLLVKKLEPKDIIDCGKIVNLMRNLCAHDLRVYDFKPYANISVNHPANLHCKTNSLARNLFAFTCSVYSLTNSRMFRTFISNMNAAFNSLSKNLDQHYINEINTICGLPTNWIELLEM